MNAHMCSNLKVGQTDHRPCDRAPMTSQHLLQGCLLYDVRRETWPKDSSLRNKLFGYPTLRRTAAFINLNDRRFNLAFEEDEEDFQAVLLLSCITSNSD